MSRLRLDLGRWGNAVVVSALGIAMALSFAAASRAGAFAILGEARFVERTGVEPTLIVSGEVLSWEAIDPTNSYVLRRKVPGQPVEYALVKSMAALAPAIAGTTVGYSVKAVFGSRWSPEVTITYPAAASLQEATASLAGSTTVVELTERRFVAKTAAEPELLAAEDVLSWDAIDPTNSYELRRKVPGRPVEYALVKNTAAMPPVIAGQSVGYSVKAVMGSIWSSEIPINYPAAEKEEEPPGEAACDLYASNEGNDANLGLASSPLRTLKALVQRLRAGQTGCLMAGQTFSGGVTLYGGDSHGVAGAPVTITSTNPARPATISGRVVTQTGADWLTFTHLNFRWNEELGIGLPQITVGSQHTSWTYDDVENHNTTICMTTIASVVYGTAYHTLIDHDRIHSCGGPIPYSSPLSNGYTSHGVYVIGYYTTITNNYIYHESGRGVQLRGSHHAVVQHNVIDENGAGVVFGDLGSSDNEVAYNIITNSSRRINKCCNVYGAYSWWGGGGPGSGNTLHNNCLYGNDDGNVSGGGGGFAAAENRIADPRYVEPAARNYKLQPGSPCLGYGPDTAQP